MDEKISVIICTKDRKNDLLECIKSVCGQTLLPNDVVIIDSSEKPENILETRDLPNQEIKIRHIHTTKPGLTRQRNIGIENCQGTYLMFLDDDTVLDRDYIKEVMRIFDIYKKEKIGGVIGRVIENDNKGIKRFLWHCNQLYSTVFLLPRCGDGKFQLSGSPTVINTHCVKEIKKIEYLQGCNMTFRREVFDEFRFDEKLPGSTSGWIGEDDDVAYYTSRTHQNLYTPFAKLIHKVSPSARPDDYNKMKTVIQISHYLFRKNLPQDSIHKFAFWWATAGLLVKETVMGLKRGNIDGARGFVSGCKAVLKI